MSNFINWQEVESILMDGLPDEIFNDTWSQYLFIKTACENGYLSATGILQRTNDRAVISTIDWEDLIIDAPEGDTAVHSPKDLHKADRGKDYAGLYWDECDIRESVPAFHQSVARNWFCDPENENPKFSDETVAWLLENSKPYPSPETPSHKEAQDSTRLELIPVSLLASWLSDQHKQASALEESTPRRDEDYNLAKTHFAGKFRVTWRRIEAARKKLYPNGASVGRPKSQKSARTKTQ